MLGGGGRSRSVCFDLVRAKVFKRASFDVHVPEEVQHSILAFVISLSDDDRGISLCIRLAYFLHLHHLVFEDSNVQVSARH